MFHFGGLTIAGVKESLRLAGYPVRLPAPTSALTGPAPGPQREGSGATA